MSMACIMLQVSRPSSGAGTSWQISKIIWSIIEFQVLGRLSNKPYALTSLDVTHALVCFSTAPDYTGFIDWVYIMSHESQITEHVVVCLQSEHWADGVEFIRISRVTVLLTAIMYHETVHRYRERARVLRFTDKIAIVKLIQNTFSSWVDCKDG